MTPNFVLTYVISNTLTFPCIENEACLYSIALGQNVKFYEKVAFILNIRVQEDL